MLTWIICIVFDGALLAPAVFFIISLIKSKPKGIEWIPVVVSIIASLLLAIIFTIYPL
jgi:hypothetical protein